MYFGFYAYRKACLHVYLDSRMTHTMRQLRNVNHEIGARMNE